MLRLFALAPSLFLLSLGCASSSGGNGAPENAPEAASKEAREIEKLGRKLEIARARLELAQLEEQAYVAEHEVGLRHATAEIGLAEASLARFRDAEAPTRLAKTKLDLRTARDRAQEAAEELAQIEIMYEDQDLDDMTAEFVVSRGRRNAERAAARIAIQEAELEALEQRELPQEQQELELELDKAVANLSELERDGKTGLHGKVISVKEAQNEIAGLEADLAEKKEEAKE